MNTKMLAFIVRALLLSAAAGRYVALDDSVGAGIAFIAALMATLAAVRTSPT